MLERDKVEKVIGKTFADGLDELLFNASEELAFSKRMMVEELGCANFIAAVKLGKVLRRLGIKTSAQLFKLDPMSLARAKGIGEAALFVAMCVLDANKYDVVKWWGKENKFNSVKKVTRRAKKRTQEV